MHWEKTITIHLTLRSLVGAILTASTVVNLVIVGAAYGANMLPTTPTATMTTAVVATVVIIPTSAAKTMFTSTPTQLPVETPTNTPGMPPTNTFTPTETATDAPISILCVKRFFWPVYRVQPGDWLITIAAATGTTYHQLMAANCLPNTRIYAGQLLYVPRLPVIITPMLSATPTATQTATSTPTATATDTATPTPTTTNTPTDIPTATPTYTASPTPTASNSPPEVSIRYPADGSRYPYDGRKEPEGWYTIIDLGGSASDAEDDVLDTSSLVWITDRTDIQDSFLGIGFTLNATLYSNSCAGEWHTITLTGRDSQGAAASATIRIFIGESQLC